MVRPSNPVVMSAVLNAVAQHSNGKGSTVRDILNFVRQNSNGFSRNLTMQVRRALQHAVNAGLLRYRGGRYKVLISVNPISAQQSLPEDSKSDDDIADKVPNDSLERSKRRVRESDKKQSSKLSNRKRVASKSGQREYKRHQKHAVLAKEAKVTKKQRRKSNGKMEVYDDWTPPARRKRLVKRKPSDIEQEDLSPSSDRSREQICASGSDMSCSSTERLSSSSKSKFYARDRLLSPGRKRSQTQQQLKGQVSRARSRKRSTSRNRSPQHQNYSQNQQQQHQQLEIQEVPPNDNLDDVGIECVQVHGNVEHSDEVANPDTDRTCKANNSGSGSSL